MIPTLTLICHSFWHIIWKYIDGLWYNPLTVYPGFYLAVYLTFYSGILSRIYSDILSGILRGIYTYIFSGILIWHAIWHSIWHSLLAFYQKSFLIFFSGILSGISSEILCGWGLAGNSLIRSSRWRSEGEHCDLALAVEVQRGALWSWACCPGSAGNAAI